MAKNKIDEFIRRETSGPSIGEVVTKAAITGALIGVAKVISSFKSK